MTEPPFTDGVARVWMHCRYCNRVDWMTAEDRRCLTCEKEELAKQQAARIAELEAEAESQRLTFGNLRTLVVRLARRLPETDDVRIKAFDYLKRAGFTGNILRESSNSGDQPRKDGTE